MFCENCGTKLPDGVKFCAGCGAKTAPAQPANAEEERPAVNTAEPPIYKPPAQTAPPPPPYTPPPAQTAYAPQQTNVPQPAAYSGQPGTEPLRVGQYIGMLLLMCVPILNIILLFVWSFGRSVNLNKKNYARAMLIVCAIGLIFSIIFGAALTSIIGELLGGMGGYY